VYTEKLTRTGRLPAVTISRKGIISLNVAICRIFKKNGIEAVLLLSDSDGRKFALRAASKNEKLSYPVGYTGSSGYVTARSFLISIGWDGEKYKIDACWDEASSLVEFRMPEWGRKESGRLVPLPYGSSSRVAGAVPQKAVR
jgi:hypothetical protein